MQYAAKTALIFLLKLSAMPTILTAGYILEISGRVRTLILVNQRESFAFTHVHSVKILLILFGAWRFQSLLALFNKL